MKGRMFRHRAVGDTQLVKREKKQSRWVGGRARLSVNTDPDCAFTHRQRQRITATINACRGRCAACGVVITTTSGDSTPANRSEF